MQHEFNKNGKRYKITLEELPCGKDRPVPELSFADLKNLLEIVMLPKAPRYDRLENAELVAGTYKVASAPLPGTIIHVGIKPGDTVQKGDLLMVLEAMKMENEICSPTSGVVREVLAEIGDVVKAKAILVTFE